jgi:tetratricopeptide (TPR) repeat protein
VERYPVKRIILGLLPFLLVSCNAYFPHLRVIRANYNVSRGEYQPAIVDYLRAQDAPEYAEWISYNLGTVYHYLGEAGAAGERWEEARASGVDDLVFGSSFNRGVFLFEQGRYAEAFREFRFALMVNPSNRPAKANLELTLERMAAGSELEGEGGRGDTRDGETPDDSTAAGGSNRMLDYVRRKEEQRWRANSEESVPEGERDW